MRTQGAEIAQQGEQACRYQAPTPSLPMTCRCAAWWRPRCSMCWSGSAIPIRGARRGQGAVAQCGCLEAARSVCGDGRAEHRQARARTAGVGAETVAGPASRAPPRRPARASSSACRRARQNWCKIERTDTAGNDRGAVVARTTAAALRNDSNEARRELKTLEPADRAAAQSWLGQGRRARCRAGRLPSIRDRRHGCARPTGAIRISQ